MNRKNLLIIGSITILLAFACINEGDKAEAVPSTLVPVETFERVLADFALAESATNMNVKNVSAYRLDTVYAFDPLAENGIRKSQFDSTLVFYSRHPALYKKVYENVLTLLSEMQTRHDSISVKRTDSLTPQAK